MTDTATPHADANRSAELFARQWVIYRKVIRYNYMGHDQITEALRDLLARRRATSAILDLGCGDAEIPSRYLPTLDVEHYHGVDLAQQPLDLAATRLAGLPTSIELHLRDQAAFLAETDRTFDVIVLGFALHHNTHDQKTAILRNAAARLAPGGDLIIYDVFRRDDEDRAAYLDRYMRWGAETWDRMTPAEHTLVDEHIRANDHPESPESLAACAREAGLSEPRQRCATEDGFHRLMTLHAAH